MAYTGVLSYGLPPMRAILAEASRSPLAKQVEGIVMSTPVTDIHTHLYDPAFNELLLWGIDDLLVYHYLVAEVFRYLDLPYDKFWSLSKTQQADLIWEQLFLEHSPVSEACRGVLTTLHSLGLDVKKRDLPALRKWFASQTVDQHITRCMELAGVRKICHDQLALRRPGTAGLGEGIPPGRSFRRRAAHRPAAVGVARDRAEARPLGLQGAAGVPPRKTFDEVRRFLADWTKRIDAHYVMVSLPPDFEFPRKEHHNSIDRESRAAALPRARPALRPDARREAGHEPATETGGRRRGHRATWRCCRTSARASRTTSS